MPLIRVELFDYRMSDDTWVIVEGHNPKNWGLAGKPWPVDEMPPAPSS
jgi:phenylpyruvate tautomerase PptA (4-oxalocrotonate tautomerase family)